MPKYNPNNHCCENCSKWFEKKDEEMMFSWENRFCSFDCWKSSLEYKDTIKKIDELFEFFAKNGVSKEYFQLVFNSDYFEYIDKRMAA